MPHFKFIGFSVWENFFVFWEDHSFVPDSWNKTLPLWKDFFAKPTDLNIRLSWIPVTKTSRAMFDYIDPMITVVRPDISVIFLQILGLIILYSIDPEILKLPSLFRVDCDMSLSISCTLNFTIPNLEASKGMTLALQWKLF